LLASDLIDLYPNLSADQRPTVDRGLAALAGSDVVEIMAGRGLSEGSANLHLTRERARVLDDIRRHPVPEAPAEE
jgi:malate/lactate dehydrogenase